MATAMKALAHCSGDALSVSKPHDQLVGSAGVGAAVGATGAAVKRVAGASVGVYVGPNEGAGLAVGGDVLCAGVGLAVGVTVMVFGARLGAELFGTGSPQTPGATRKSEYLKLSADDIRLRPHLPSL